MDDDRISEQVAKVGDDAKSGIDTVKETVTDVAGKAQTQRSRRVAQCETQR
jgi:hypothetical protein